MNRPFRIIAPPHTPFTIDGHLNLEVVSSQASLLQSTGVDTVFVCGTTGEMTSLSLEERMTLTERWCAVTAELDIEVIVQVGHNGQGDARRLAAHALAAGADAVAAHAPSYFKPRTVEDLIDFLAPVAAEAGDLPFYFYDIPSMTGVRLPMVPFLETGKSRIPNLVGLKYSNDDLVQLQECVQLQDRQFEILFGSDEQLLAAAALGVSGAVGSTYNFAAPLYRRMLQAWEAGDFAAAQSAQYRAVVLFRLLEKLVYLPASKALMGLLGVDCGPVRPPLRNLLPAEIATLRRQLEDAGFLQQPGAHTNDPLSAQRFEALC